MPESLLRRASLIAMDIPIGLPPSGDRACDLAARALLPPSARACVFTGLRRPLLSWPGDYAAANAWAKSDGKGLSRQAWGLLRKVAEVDCLLHPGLQAQVREAHPELAFRRIAAGAALVGKKSSEGRAQRLRLLARAGAGDVRGWLDRFPRSRVQPDDLLDAAVLALLAEEMAAGGGRRVPENPPRDERGLAMEIWY